MKFYLALASAAVLFAGNAIAQTSEIPELIAEGWECESLRDSLENEPAANLVYSDRPPVPSDLSVWKFDRGGVTVPVPAVAYTDVLVVRPQPETPVLVYFFKEAEDDSIRTIIGQYPKEEPIVDLFSPDSEPTDEGRALTEQLFGGPVALETLIDLGYEHRPDDLTCEDDRWQTEVPVGLGLILSSLGAPGGEPQAVYRQDSGGWLIKSEQDNWVAWQASILRSDSYIDISTILPASHPAANLGLAIDHSSLASVTEAADRPQWLDVLETAIAEDTEASWEAFASAIEAAQLSDRSVESAREVAGSAD